MHIGVEWKQKSCDRCLEVQSRQGKVGFVVTICHRHLGSYAQLTLINSWSTNRGARMQSGQ